MSIGATSRDDHLLSTARAWFPAPEFKCAISYNVQSYAMLLRIAHIESMFYVDQCIEYDDSFSLPDHFMECAARTMHHGLARRGIGRVIRIGWGDPRDRAAIQTLFDLMNLKLISRKCQGYHTFAEHGEVLYLVKVGAWAQPVKADSLDNPLPYWQNMVSSLIQQEQRA